MEKYFVYYLLMSVVLFIFMYLGGSILYSSFHQENYKAQAELHQFRFGYLSPEAGIKNNLFHLELVFDTLHFEKNYYYEQCNPIKKFLSTKGLLPNTNAHPAKDITEILPVILNDKQLETTKVVYHVNAKKSGISEAGHN